MKTTTATSPSIITNTSNIMSTTSTPLIKSNRRVRSVFTKLLLGVFVVLCSVGAKAQVSVTATAGTVGPTAYTTLKLAFDAINAGTHQGVITVDISANTTEGTTPATLNSTGAGSAVDQLHPGRHRPGIPGTC